MLRSTKIVATLGPASSEPGVLERMIRSGVDVVRLNFSHGTADDHLKRAALVKDIARKVGRTVAIMCDLQGPKIRIGKFKDGKTTLEKGTRFVLDAGCALGDGDRVGLDYKELPRDVEAGALLLLDDGKIVLEVIDVRDLNGVRYYVVRLGDSEHYYTQALHWAAATGMLDIVDMLLERGAPLEVRNTWGGTVLDSTIWFVVNFPQPDADYPRIIERLLQAGADPDEVYPPVTGFAAVDRLLEKYRNVEKA